MLRAAKSSILLRVVSLACTLVQVRLTMPYLGEERFGFWTVLMAIGGFFGISDLGVSSAFQNDVTNAEARGESSRLRAMFLTAQATLLLLALTGALVVIAVVAVVGKATFFRNLSPELAGQAVTQTAVFVLGGTLNAPLALAGRLAFGMHLGHLANFTVLVAQLLTLIAMVGAAMLRAPFAVFLLATIIPSLCCNLALGMRLLARLEPSPRNWEGAAYAKHTIRSGVQFLALGASLPLFFAMGHRIRPRDKGARRGAQFGGRCARRDMAGHHRVPGTRRSRASAALRAAQRAAHLRCLLPAVAAVSIARAAGSFTLERPARRKFPRLDRLAGHIAVCRGDVSGAVLHRTQAA